MRILLLLPFLCSCSVLVALLGADRCDEVNFVSRCEDEDNTILCREGVEVPTACGGGCDLDTGFCAPLCGDGVAPPGELCLGAQSPILGGSQQVVAGDVNNDGSLDLVVADISGGISLLLNNGAGSFTRTTTPTGSTRFLALADLDGDDDLDAVATNANDNTMSVFSFADNVFTFDNSVPTGINPRGVVLADLTGGSSFDALIVNRDDNSLQLFDGDGFQFTSTAVVFVGGDPDGVGLADLNNDGSLDAFTTNDEDDSLSVLSSGGVTTTGIGSFGFSLGFADAADVNEDNTPDIIVPMGSNTSIAVFSKGAQGVPDLFSVESDAPFWVATGDLNNDSHLDVVTANEVDDGSVLLGDGQGSFTFDSLLPTSLGPNSVVLGDFNKDDSLDVVFSCGGEDRLNVYLSNP